MIGNSLATYNTFLDQIKSRYIRKSRKSHCKKNKVFHYEQETPDLVTFTEDVSKGKLHFFV